ncbi:MAG: hypothetical protein KFH87_08795 [Bacteroidetes bacterium]|nr:hypothetical protein [Bacteroidota bacterium]
MKESMPGSRSTSVTVIAWGMLVYGILLTTLMGFFYLILPDLGELMRGAEPVPDMERIAAILTWLLGNMHVMLLVSVFLYLLHVGAGIGLLQRAEWGRLLAVGISLLMIFASLINLSVGAYLYREIYHVMDDSMRSFTISTSVSTVVMTLLWTGLYAYIVYKLTRPEIREEYESTTHRGMEKELRD